MTGDRFNDGYKAAEAHWRKRWYAANADHQAAVTEVERLNDEAEAKDRELYRVRRHRDSARKGRDAALARLAAVEALADEWDKSDETHEWILAADLRAVLSAAPTDTTKEN